jgi:hypothetical protein
VILRAVRGLGEGPRGLGGQGLTEWGRKPRIFWALDDFELPMVKPLVFHYALLTLTKGCVMLSASPVRAEEAVDFERMAYWSTH